MSGNHLLQEVEGESCGEVAGEDEGVEEQPLRRRTLLRVLGQSDLHETANRRERYLKLGFTLC